MSRDLLLLASQQQASGGAPSGIPIVESFTEVVNTSATSSITVNKPSGVTSGDLLVIFVTNDIAGQNFTPQFDQDGAPTGFNYYFTDGDATSNSHMAVYYKIADGLEGASFTVTYRGGSAAGWASCIRISGADTTTPIGISSSIDDTGASAIIPSMTTTENNSLILYALGTDGSNTAPFGVSGTGWSETNEIDNISNDTTGTEGVWGQKDLAVAGATGDVTITLSTATGYVGMQIEIRSQQTFGANIITNGDMSSATGWLLRNSSTISGGIATVIGNGATNADTANWSLEQDLGGIVGWSDKIWELTFDARQTVGSGQLQIGQRFSWIRLMTVTGTLTTYKIYFRGISTNDHIVFGAEAGNTFEIDNVILREY